MDNPNETRDFASGTEGFVAGQLAAWEVPGCAVARLVVQPLGIFRPKKGDGA